MNSSSLVLPPLSALYGAAIRTRLAAYRRGLFSTSRLAVPVISVGNITVGGTGKTPLVEWICRALARERRTICVLTRGYKRENPNSRVLVSDGSSIKASEREAGDEALLLAEKLLGLAAVVSDANRVAAGTWAIAELGADALVLDDGFQHLQVARDLNVLTIDATDPWGGSQLLPYGKLREPLSGLGRADCVVITRTDESDKPESLIADVRRLIQDRPVFTSRMKSLGIKTLNGDRVNSILQPVSAFCGIGNPESFFNHVRRNHLPVALTQTFPDHHNYDQKEIDNLVAQARQHDARALVTTAKDAVKLRTLRFDIPCFVLEIEIAIDEADRFLYLMRTALRK